MAISAVPVHTLYGEREGPVVDFIHIEPLRSRSELFDWSIDAHTHAGLLQVMLVFEGRARVTLDGAAHDLGSPAAVATPPGVVHSFAFEPDSIGFVITLADGLLDSTAMGPWVRAQLFRRGTAFRMEADAGLVRRLEVLCAQLLHEHDTPDTGSTPTMDWLAQTILVLLAREAEKLHEHTGGQQPSDRFRDFREAVEAHYTDQWPVGRYAELLHMSESSLNRLCTRVTGTTAFEIIQGRLELEARRRLAYTTVPIHRIAADLGFLDPAYFSRFFRRRTGTSPRQFRGEHQQS